MWGEVESCLVLQQMPELGLVIQCMIEKHSSWGWDILAYTSKGPLREFLGFAGFHPLSLHFNKKVVFSWLVNSNMSQCVVTRPNQHAPTQKSFLRYKIYHKLKQKLFIERNTHYSCNEITRNSTCHSFPAPTPKILAFSMCMLPIIETCGQCSIIVGIPEVNSP